MSKFLSLVFEGLGFPVLRFLGRLEGGVLTDSSMGVRVDFFDIFRTNTIRKIRRELLLKAAAISENEKKK